MLCRTFIYSLAPLCQQRSWLDEHHVEKSGHVETWEDVTEVTVKMRFIQPGNL